MLSLSLVMQGQALHGLYIGTLAEAWNQAADLSEQLNIIYVDRPYRQVLLAPAEMYDDLGTAAKAMYKTEPAIANGGEVIIYAPHITEVSYSHGKLLDEVGYHVKEYFLKQWERFQGVPGGILAHSTHVKGTGTYDGRGARHGNVAHHGDAGDGYSRGTLSADQPGLRRLSEA